MSLEEKVIAAFQNQEAGFSQWRRQYYSAAFDLELLRREMGKVEFSLFLSGNFSPAQIDVVGDMHHKLFNTPTGAAMLKHHADTGDKLEAI